MAEQAVDSKTILMMGFPSGWSHYFQQVKLARQLIAKGHKVIFICDSATRQSKVDFSGITEVITYEVGWTWQEVKEYWAKASRLDPVKGTQHIVTFICDYMRKMCAAIKLDDIRKRNIDFCVLDHVVMQCGFFVDLLEIPTMLYHTVGGYEPVAWYYGFDTDLSCVPMMGSGFTKDMDEISQITNVAFFWANKNAYEDIFVQYGNCVKEGWPDEPKQPGMDKTLLLGRSPWVLGGVWPVPPSIEFRQELPKDTYFIPPLLPEPGAPLPKEYTDILNKCEKAAIFSLGTFGFTDEEGMEVDQRIVDACGDLGIPVFMKTLGPNIKIPPTVHCMDWLPQNDLLAHEKIQLFVTHCGMNSLVESCYHGTPMVGVPRFGDQFDNCARTLMSGAALKLDVKVDDKAAMTSKMQRILDEPQFMKAAQAMSVEMKATKLMSCVDRVEYFMKEKVNATQGDLEGYRPLGKIIYPEHFQEYLSVAGIEIDLENDSALDITGKLMGPLMTDYEKYSADVAQAVANLKPITPAEQKGLKKKFQKAAAADTTATEVRKANLVRLSSSQRLLLTDDEDEEVQAQP